MSDNMSYCRFRAGGVAVPAIILCVLLAEAHPAVQLAYACALGAWARTR